MAAYAVGGVQRQSLINKRGNEMEKNFYYTILGVNPDAAKEEIEFRYRELVKKYHPDTGIQNDSMFKLLTEARDTLTDDRKRKEYDEKQNGTTHSAYEGESQADDSVDESDESPRLRTYMFHFDIAQLIVIQVLLLFFVEKAVYDAFGYVDFPEFAVITVVLLWAGLVLLRFMKRKGLFKSVFFVIIALHAIMLIYYASTFVFHFGINGRGFLMAFMMIVPIFVWYLSTLKEIISMLPLRKQLGSFRKITLGLGMLCNLALLILCLAVYPGMYRFGCSDAARETARIERKEGRERYLSDIAYRDVPDVVPTEGAVSAGGQISKDTVIEFMANYDVVKDHAVDTIEKPTYFYPFESLTGEAATEYLTFVSDTSYRYTNDLENYEFCVIRYKIEGYDGNEYDSISMHEAGIHTGIQPIDEKYENGYYINNKLLKPTVEAESFGTSDGYIILKLPNGFHDYDLSIRVGGGEEFDIDVNDYYAAD